MAATFVTTALGDQAVLHCRGELDLATRRELTAHLSDVVLMHPTRAVVDLDGVTFMDCGSVTAIEMLARRIAPEGSTYVVAPPGLVRRLLSAIELDPLVQVRPTLAEVPARVAG